MGWLHQGWINLAIRAGHFDGFQWVLLVLTGSCISWRECTIPDREYLRKMGLGH
jgi:hypothetical protein